MRFFTFTLTVCVGLTVVGFLARAAISGDGDGVLTVFAAAGAFLAAFMTIALIWRIVTSGRSLSIRERYGPGAVIALVGITEQSRSALEQADYVDELGAGMSAASLPSNLTLVAAGPGVELWARTGGEHRLVLRVPWRDVGDVQRVEMRMSRLNRHCLSIAVRTLHGEVVVPLLAYRGDMGLTVAPRGDVDALVEKLRAVALVQADVRSTELARNSRLWHALVAAISDALRAGGAATPTAEIEELSDSAYEAIVAESGDALAEDPLFSDLSDSGLHAALQRARSEARF